MKISSLPYLLLLIWTLVAASDPGEDEFLYLDPDENEPVIEYVPGMAGKPTRGDFRKSTKPKMIEFYNPYCGACQSYKPTYLKLSSDLVDKVGEDMEIYAVSCQVHKDLCDLYDIQQLPTVGLFQEGEQDPENMKRLKVPEKNPGFIIPYLFPDRSSSVKRGLAEEGEESGEEEEGNNSEEEKSGEEEEDKNDSEEGEEEEDKNDSEEAEEEEGKNESEEGEGEEDNDESGDGEENENGGEEEEDKDESQEEEGEEENENVENESDEDNEAGSEDKEDGSEELSEGGDEEENGNENVSEEDNEGEKAAEDDDETATEADIEEANKEFFDDNKPRQPGIGPVDSPKVIAGAGAGMSKEMMADMDRFQEAMKKHHSESHGVFRRQEPLGVHNHKVKSDHFDNVSGATKAMKAHMPGTTEYETRQKKIQTHHEALLRKKNLRTTAPQKRFSAGAGGASRLPYKKQLQTQKLAHRIGGRVPLIKHFVVLSNEEELILDASLSFMYALKVGLFSNSDPLSKSKKKAFQGWLDLLRVSLPPEWGLHEVIMDLDNNIDFISQNNANLNTFLSRHELPRKEWSHTCTANGIHNGFNCGFWRLLHVVSVGVAEHRGGLNLQDFQLGSKDARVFSPHDAAETMKDFIANFFFCTECRNHFVAQYDECSNRRCVRLTDQTDYASFADWQEVAKWLWEVHNDVNVRLQRERNEMSQKKRMTVHDDIKVLYPSLQACVSCFRGDGGYDEDAVFLYLEKEYWPGASEIDPAADKLLYFHDTEYAGIASSWALLFLGVCIIYRCRPRGVFKGQKKRAD